MFNRKLNFLNSRHFPFYQSDKTFGYFKKKKEGTLHINVMEKLIRKDCNAIIFKEKTTQLEYAHMQV